LSLAAGAVLGIIGFALGVYLAAITAWRGRRPCTR
jgi:hypothetical protein